MKDTQGDPGTTGAKETNAKCGEQEEVPNEKTRVLQAALHHVVR